MTKKLLIISSDFISAWVEKGEVVPRYYNPGNLFDEVHIMMTNDDRPDPTLVQSMVGDAKLFLYNYPEPPRFFKKTLGWRPWLIKKWSNGAVELARKIHPDIVRCYGLHLNAFLGAQIKKKLGIPFLVSLHINPDENFRKVTSSLKKRFIFCCLKSIEAVGLKWADLVLPVYQPIVPYLEKRKVRNFEVCYNVVNGSKLKKKDDYDQQSGLFKLLCVGNLHEQKNPENIVKAFKGLKNVCLDIVGNGPLRNGLMELVAKEGFLERIAFVASMPNEKLCEILPTYDAVVLHTEHYEFSKVMIESALCGVPLIVNSLRSGLSVSELDGICLFVESSPEGYTEGITRLMGDAGLRKRLGNAAYKKVSTLCGPLRAEAKFEKIYRSFLASER
ncbi:MAG TPA: group 1 glycosyl transferase [Holosporales bacterium]|nr:group 1 glycosyl transferase [Holosporales bacterium]